MRAERKTWLVVVNECPYHQRSSKAHTTITAALLQFHLDHPKNPMTDFSIYCHNLSPEEEQRAKNFPKQMKQL